MLSRSVLVFHQSVTEIVGFIGSQNDGGPILNTRVNYHAEPSMNSDESFPLLD